MTTERLLSVVATLKAYANGDAEGIEALIMGGAAESYADLLEFSFMMLNYDSEGSAVAYLDHMAESLMVIRMDEATRP